MHDVMLDLETMGTGPRAAIVAIGAVEFDTDTGTVGECFYRAVDLATSVSMGGEMDASTVLWWMQQGDEARAAFSKGGGHLSKALMDFSSWLHERGTTDNLRVWGNGAAFDNVILASAYRAAMQVQPWRHWNDRCYRTIKAQHPSVKMARTGVYHNAAADAESQARHLVAMLKGLTFSAAVLRPLQNRVSPPVDRREDRRMPRFDTEAFMKTLARAAKRRGKTMKEVAAETGVSETTLSRMNGGKRVCGAASMAALSAWAGINPARFSGLVLPRPVVDEKIAGTRLRANV